MEQKCLVQLQPKREQELEQELEQEVVQEQEQLQPEQEQEMLHQNQEHKEEVKTLEKGMQHLHKIGRLKLEEFLLIIEPKVELDD